MPQNLKLLGPTANGEKAKQVHKLTADLICAPKQRRQCVDQELYSSLILKTKV